MWVSLKIINKLSLTLLALALPPTWEPGPGQAAAAKLVGEPSRGLELTSTVAWHLAWQPHNRDTLQGLSQVRTASGSAKAEIQADCWQSSLRILTNTIYNLGLLCVKSRENWIEFSLLSNSGYRGTFHLILGLRGNSLMRLVFHFQWISLAVTNKQSQGEWERAWLDPHDISEIMSRMTKGWHKISLRFFFVCQEAY